MRLSKIKGSGKRRMGIVVGALLVVSACASQRPVPPKAVAAPRVEVREFEFSEPLFVPSGFEVTDRSDPEQLIKKGIEQSEKERPGFAAEFFRMASATPAPDSRLKVSTLFAAANEHLRLGNLKGFFLCMEEAERNMDKFQRASLNDQEATLMALYDLTRGRGYVTGIHPDEAHQLFETMEEE